MLAARCGALKAMDALISAYARLDATDRQGLTALLIAINCNRRQAAHLLLERGAKLEEADYLGRTGLVLAAEQGHASILEDLLKRRPNLNAANFEGMNALMLAAREGHPDSIKLLIDGDTELERVNRLGMTALQLAAREGHLENVRLLLAAGANPHHAANNQETALHIASEKGWCQLAKTLIAHEPQPDLNATDAKGDTPVKLAARNGHTRLMDLLLYSGGGAERPHTRQFQQLKDYLDGIAAQRGLQTQGGFADLLGQLALRDNPSAENTTAGPSPESAKLFNLAEQFLLGEGRPLSAMGWHGLDEMQQLTNSPRLQERDRAWRNLSFLARHQVAFSPAGLLFSLAMREQLQRKKPKSSAFPTAAPAEQNAPAMETHPATR